MKIYIDTSVINGLYANDALWIKEASKLFFEIVRKKRYEVYPPTQKTTGLPVDECENDNSFASADVRPFLEKADRYSAKLPNENFGAKQNHLEGTTALAVGLHISDLVIAELERTPSPAKRKQLLQVIKRYKLKQLSTTEKSEQLAQQYLESGVIPHKYLPDALHISLATVYKISVIVSWNFKHIVRHKTRIMVNKINKRWKHIEIDICSPEEVD